MWWWLEALPCHRSSPVRSCSSPTVHGYFLPACPGHCLGEGEEQSADRKREQMVRSDDKKMPTGHGMKTVLVFFPWWYNPHLGGVNRSGDEGGLWEKLGGSQQVTDSLVVPLVLLHRLYVHLLFGQQRLVARRVTSWWQELEISVASTQQKTHPEIGSYKLYNILTLKFKSFFLLTFHLLFKLHIQIQSSFS